MTTVASTGSSYGRLGASRRSIGVATRIKRVNKNLVIDSSSSKDVVGVIAPFSPLSITKEDGPSASKVNCIASPGSFNKKRRTTLGQALRLLTPSKVKHNFDKENEENSSKGIDQTEYVISNEEPAVIEIIEDNSIDESTMKAIAPDQDPSYDVQSNVLSEINDGCEFSEKDFIDIKPIGHGKFGYVYRARQRTVGTSVALKVLMKQQILSMDCLHMLKREIEIHSRMHHPNIVKLYG